MRVSKEAVPWAWRRVVSKEHWWVADWAASSVDTMVGYWGMNLVGKMAAMTAVQTAGQLEFLKADPKVLRWVVTKAAKKAGRSVADWGDLKVGNSVYCWVEWTERTTAEKWARHWAVLMDDLTVGLKAVMTALNWVARWDETKAVH